MAKNKGLGRGLDAIFEDNSIEEHADKGAVSIRLSIIEPNRDQPRKQFDRESLASLADSIAQNGVLQPIIVKESMGGMYTIIAGERRWRASKMAGLTEIPAIILDTDKLSAAKIAMIENLQREDLNPYEEALGYRDLIDNYGLTQEDISRTMGKSRSAVANALRLLDLPPEIIEMIVDRSLSAGHGRALLGLRDKSKMLPIAQRIVVRNLSVREIEAAVKNANKAADIDEDGQTKHTTEVDYVSDLENKVTGIIGRRCKITHTPKKRTVQIEYTDDDDLQALLKLICGREPIED